uniref:Uncharacterized protein n=1 Tax=Anguilla anguilla TaxID=7936 RepID=A0A0E9XGJ0_ANGAN
MRACLASACTPPVTNCPEEGSIPSCPEMYMVRSTTTAWLYGPMAAGALVVLIIFLMIADIAQEAATVSQNQNAH